MGEEGERGEASVLVGLGGISKYCSRTLRAHVVRLCLSFRAFSVTGLSTLKINSFRMERSLFLLSFSRYIYIFFDKIH